MEQPINIFSKEAIRARMIQNATHLWGLKNAQSLDPFVKLLIEAFSTEIFKVSNEVNNIKIRMLEKVARLLTPNIYTIPQPAHAIAFGQPVDATCILKSNNEFFFNRQFPSSLKANTDVKLEVPFTAIDNVKLIKARVAGLFAGNKCFIMDEQNNKIPLSKITGNLPYGNIWLAIDVDIELREKLDELCLYFNCPDHEHEDWIYSLLPYSIFKVGDKTLEVQKGINFQEEFEGVGYKGIFKDHSTYKKMQERVKSIYINQFITLKNISISEEHYKSGMPQQLNDFRELSTVSNMLNKDYLWVSIQLPPQYNYKIAESFCFALNAFPVINRKWKQRYCKFDVAGSNIPLVTSVGEHFLLVDEVVDGAGIKYEEIPYSRGKSLEKGLYSIRISGMERFDERNAVDLINYVLELTRDEVAAFGTVNRDTVITSLREMVIQMNLLQRKATLSDDYIKQVPSYVIVEPLTENESMYAAYWITNCTLANNLRAGFKLQNLKSSLIHNGNIILLTNSIGGDEIQGGVDALQAYRYALTSRDRIITIEDIKNFCKMELRSHFKEIFVKKGTAISHKPKEGFIRTLEVIITVNDYEFFNESYWNNTAKTLKQQIELRAVDGIEYIIIFKN